MSTDVADLLHESIDRLTQGERMPDGLAGRAFRHHRQRRIALGAAGITGTALAAAITVLGATSVTSTAPQPRGGGLPAQTTAYVVGRAERALAAAERGNLMQELRVTAHGSLFILATQVPTTLAERAEFWTYRGQFRDEGFTARGTPVFNASAVYVPAGQRRTVLATGVDYGSRTWSRWTVRAHLAPRLPRGPCSAYLPAPVGEQINWPARIREALRCAAYRATGRQWIDGIHTIRIATARPPGGVGQIFWVDPATYLPVRAVWAWPSGKPTTVLSGDFRWLAPTKARLAALRVSVPAGFRRVHPRAEVPGVNFSLSLPRGLPHVHHKARNRG